MIFVTNAQGQATFVGREWTEFTGQALEEAVNFGWTTVVHPEDREVARKTVADAIQAQCAFSLRYRIMTPDGQAVWVAAGAVPSFGPPDQTFLGFLGSITPIAEDRTTDLRAQGSIGSFAPPRPQSTTKQASALEAIADHLLTAHTLIAHTDADRLRPLMEDILHAVGVELARAEGKGRILDNFH
ncbi:PAS domain-containing protein [Methylobacterium sp. A49B]|nr:PAS domain-containing protein [Methylobacterium mesophilicum]